MPEVEPGHWVELGVELDSAQLLVIVPEVELEVGLGPEVELELEPGIILAFVPFLVTELEVELGIVLVAVLI